MHAKVDPTTPTPVPPDPDFDVRVRIDTNAANLADEVSRAVMAIVADKLAEQATEQPSVIETSTAIPNVDLEDIETTTMTSTTSSSGHNGGHRPHHNHHRHHLHGHELTEAQRDHIRDLKICVKLYNFYPGHTWYRKLCREILKRKF